MTVVLGAGSQLYVQADPGGENLFGDTDGTLSSGRGGNDRILIATEPGSTPAIHGDAYALDGDARGGHDLLVVEGGGLIYGDAAILQGNARGGSDLIIASGDDIWIFADGDLVGHARGADDIVRVSGDDAFAIGDGQYFEGAVHGGADLLDGGNGSQNLYGDSLILAYAGASQQCGDDRLYGGAGDDVVSGDTRQAWNGTGGDDRLFGGTGNDTIHGDSDSAGQNGFGPGMSFHCGDDTVVGGAGDDRLFGDVGLDYADLDLTAGADRFVFRRGGLGDDIIGDFQQAVDLIDVRGLGIRAFARLDIDEIGSSSVITWANGDTLTVVDVTGLTAGDFIFA